MCPKFPRLVGAGLCFAASVSSLRADRWKGAEVTQIIHDVRVVPPDTRPRPASVSDKINEGTSIQTGADSWVELKFSNQGLARLGSNSAFLFKDGSRRMNLKEGSTLLQVPKGAHGARIQGADVAAVIAGTTVMFECHPSVYKFLVLEGTARLYRPGHFGDSLLVPPGRLVIGKPNTPLSDPVDFDIGRFLKTSHFLQDFAALESGPLMAREATRQGREKAKKHLFETNLVIFGGGTSVSLLDPAKVPDAATAPSSAAPPGGIQRDAAAPPVDRMSSGR
jgi:hypothetical protein